MKPDIAYALCEIVGRLARALLALLGPAVTSWRQELDRDC